jgi:DNA transformation protein
MPVSEDFRLFVLEQLRGVTSVTSKKMFGGVGIYAGDVFFALIDDDVVYFKANDSNRDDFIKAGSKAFQPYGDGSYSMSYYELPPDVLEDEDELRAWVKRSVEAAKAKKTKKK